MKAALVLAAVCAALVAAAPSPAAGRVVERGIVQSVAPAAIVLRALDGTEVTVAVGPETRVRLNGRAATLAMVRRGFVAEAVTAASGPEAVTAASGPALVIRSFGRAAEEAVVGRLVRVRPQVIVVRSGTGERLRIPITRATRAWRGAATVGLRTLRGGMQVQIVRTPKGAARVVLVLSGGGA